MCDGELVLENSPFHQYLQEIGWNDTTVISRTESVQTTSKRFVFISSIKSFIRLSTSHFCDPVGRLFTKKLVSYSAQDLANLRCQILPKVLEPHRIHLSELQTVNLSGAYNPNSLYALHAFIFVSVLLSVSHVYWIIAWVAVGLFSLIYIFNGFQKIQAHLETTIEDHSRSFKRLKHACRILLSYLRDCQIARTSYAAGVTWSKLDKIEENASKLEKVEIRKKVLSILDSIYKLHKNIIIKALETATMIPEFHSASEYLCLQLDPIINSTEWENPSSHSLRYYLKLIEHASSEVMWKLAIGTFSSSWPNEFLNDRFIDFMLQSLCDLNRVIDEKAMILVQLHEIAVNNEHVENVSPIIYGSIKSQSNCQMIHNLQRLHSCLNIATMRCLDTHTFVIKLCEDISKNSVSETSADDQLSCDSHDISSMLSLVQLNVDMAQNILGTINTSLNPSEKKELDLQTSTDLIEANNQDATKASEQIVPYVQEGNLVFSGEGGECNTTMEGDFSDEEISEFRMRNGEERKMMLTELKHVIDTQPTCLYEDDYEEFKKTGLLNPMKEDLRDTYESNSEDEEENYSDINRAIFNPFSLGALNQLQSLTSKNSLQCELLQCEEFIGEGDASENSCSSDD